MITEPTGTDGHRTIGRTWHVSLLKSSLLIEILSLFTTRSQALPMQILLVILLKMLLLILWLSLVPNVIQDQKILTGRYLHLHGRQFLVVLTRVNHFAR